MSAHKVNSGEKKISSRSCRDSNSQLFDHESGALTNKLSRLAIVIVIIIIIIIIIIIFIFNIIIIIIIIIIKKLIMRLPCVAELIRDNT